MWSSFLGGWEISYTAGMKTAISLPDELFKAGERYAEKKGKSRSQLYAEALAEYLLRHGPDEVTAAMDRVVERLGEEAEGAEELAAGAARTILERSEW